jgi:uncharacterized membrane protein YgcG
MSKVDDSLKTRVTNYIRDNTPPVQTGATLAALKTKAVAASLLNKANLVSKLKLDAYANAVAQQKKRLQGALGNTRTYAAPYLKEGFIESVGPWMEYCIFGLVLWYVLVWMVFYPPQTDQQKSMAFMIGLIAFTAVLNTFLRRNNFNWINFYLFCGLLVLYTILKYMNIRYNQIKLGEGTNKEPNYWKLNFGMMFAFLVGIVLSYFLIKPENSMILRTLGWLLVVVMVVSKIVLMAYTFKNTDKSVYTENSNNNKKTTVVLNISEKDFYDAYQYLFLAIFGIFLYSFCLLALSFLTNKVEDDRYRVSSFTNPAAVSMVGLSGGGGGSGGGGSRQ